MRIPGLKRLAPFGALALGACISAITVVGTITLDGEPAPGWLVVIGSESSPIVYGDDQTDVAGAYRLKFTNLRGCDLAIVVYPPEDLAGIVENDEEGVALLDCGEHSVDFAYRTVTPE